jgi:hypothetical protein
MILGHFPRNTVLAELPGAKDRSFPQAATMALPMAFGTLVLGYRFGRRGGDGRPHAEKPD